MPKAGITSRDHYARLSYLYQVSQLNSGVAPALSRFYGATMKSVARKNVLRLSPAIKRSMCKKCHRILNPQSCSTRIVNNSKSKAEQNDVLEIICVCGWVKRYPVGRDPNYQLWSDQIEGERITV